jgi:hypothetical protein
MKTCYAHLKESWEVNDTKTETTIGGLFTAEINRLK